MKKSCLLDNFDTWIEYDIILPKTNELHKIFPESKKILPKLIKQDKQKLLEINKLHEKIKEICIEKIKQPKNLDYVIDLALAGYGKLKEKHIIEERIKTNTHILNNFSRTDSKSISVEEVKRIPISNLIELRHNQANCPFPDHQDKNASFTYYPQSNSFYCFGCNRGGDIINFIELLHNVNFKEALKILSK